MQPSVKKHAAVTGGENKVVAINPARLIGIMFQGMALEDGTHLGATKGQPEVARLRCLHRVHAQTAGFVSGTGENFEVQTHPEKQDL